MRDKTIILVFIISLLTIVSCTDAIEIPGKPAITISAIGNENGWQYDTISYMITIESERALSELEITPDESGLNADCYFDTVFTTQDKEASLTYSYVIPEISSGKYVDIAIKVTDSYDVFTIDSIQIAVNTQYQNTEDLFHYNKRIIDDEIWETHRKHIVVGQIEIDGGSLVIESGSVIEFQGGSRIFTNDNSLKKSSFAAIGTEDNFISFSANSANFEFNASTEKAEFQYCFFEIASGENPIINSIDNSVLKIDSCLFSGTTESCIKAEDFLLLQKNDFRNLAGSPLWMDINALTDIKNSNILNPDFPVRLEGKLNANQTISNMGYPYQIMHDVIVNTHEVSLIINQGVQILMDENISFKIANDNESSLRIVGTEENPVTITSANANPNPGDWSCIYFGEFSATDCLLSNCNISFGGGNQQQNANIVIDKTTNLSITNCEISNSAGYGILLLDGGSPANSDYVSVNSFADNALENVGSLK